MAARDAAVVLYRIGRYPDPLSGPPPGAPKSTNNRFDDPLGQFWVLYAAEQRLACFVETLARFRLDVRLLATLKALPDGDAGDDTPPAGIIPDDWHLKRRISTFRLTPGQQWLDLRWLETREMLRRQLAPTLLELGYTDFDMSDVLSRDRRLTQAVSRWAYEHGNQGIAYKSRLDAVFDCWAILEGARYEPLTDASIAGDDPDLLTAARLLRLRLAAEPEPG